MNSIIYSEVREEAERLSRVLNRSVEVAPVNCDCDYSKLCLRCGGEGLYYELRYSSCGHLVQDDNDDECDLSFCREQELARAELDSFPLQGAQIKSCREVESEREQEREVSAA